MFRYPDKPIAQLSRSGLDDLPELYVAELKFDGWRCVVEKMANGLTFNSRHKKPIPISPELRAELDTVLRSLPVGTMLDGEWLARRPSCRQESLWLFDMMLLGGSPLWRNNTVERLCLLRNFVPSELIVPCEDSGYTAFFDTMRDRDDAEGIVLKRRDASYIGSYRQCALNPGWLKCKWRAGEDGLTALEPRMSQVG